MATSKKLLFDPNAYDPSHFDPETRRQLRAVIDWFEARGKARLLRDDLEAAWVSDFLDFIKQEKIFATFLTPSEYGGGDPNKRWDTVPQCRAERDLRVLRAVVLVRRAGHHPGPRADLAERQHQGQGARGRATRGGRRDGVRAVRARARRRHLQHRHAAHARDDDDDEASSSARRGRSTTSATATWRAWCRCSRAAPTSTAPTATSGSSPTAATRTTS